MTGHDPGRANSLFQWSQRRDSYPQRAFRRRWTPPGHL